MPASKQGERTAQPTPGPWSLTPMDNRGWISVRSPDQRTIAEVICQLPAETEANARLIAAAPPMRETLKTLIHRLETVRFMYLVADTPDYRLVDKAISDAKAILAEIEGGKA